MTKTEAKIAVIGGKLQGLEAVYLAAKAGMETIVIDKREDVPARKLCSRFLCSNVLDREPQLVEELRNADFVLPALEDEEVLSVLTELSKEYNFKLAFDLEAYMVSSSKLLSDKLIHENGIPAPRYYPGCKAPYIAKPSSASGSEGVRLIETAEQMETFLACLPKDEKWVAQEFLSGRSYSIEIVGVPGSYRTYEVTEIIIDQYYDCKRVAAPCDIPVELKQQLSGIAFKLAELLQLRGIMDVEVIDDEGTLKVLEIDARFPSQTPTAVFHSSGMNLVEELRDIICYGKFLTRYPEEKKHVSFEHMLVGDRKIRALGEHIISEAGPLSFTHGFCGADEALADYVPGAACWRGTFINAAESEEELSEKRSNMLKLINLLQGEKLEYEDLGPER